MNHRLIKRCCKKITLKVYILLTHICSVQLHVLDMKTLKRGRLLCTDSDDDVVDEATEKAKRHKKGIYPQALTLSIISQSSS